MPALPLEMKATGEFPLACSIKVVLFKVHKKYFS